MEASEKSKNLERQGSLGLGRTRRISLVENPPKRKSPELEDEKEDEIEESFLAGVGESINHHQLALAFPNHCQPFLTFLYMNTQ